MKKGIDISKWQGNVDFSKVKKEVDFVILREGYRKQIDPKFLEYVKGCKNNGIPVVGVYHFCYATSEAGAVEEAKSCIANIEKAGLAKKDIVVFFDFEYDTVKQAKDQGVTLGKKQCITFTRAFCDYVECKGYTAGVYSNLDYYKNMYDKETIGKYVYWLADYTGEPDVACIYHQYTSSGKVSGISGNVDMNYYYGEDKEEESMGRTAEAYLDVWRSWIGYNESNGKHKIIIDLYNSKKPLPRGYAVKYSDEWCDTTVSAAGIKADMVDLIGRECSCQKHIDIFVEKGIWIEDGKITPKPGYIIVYNWDDGTQPNDGWADHIGVVESVSNGQITVIEGNKGQAVARRVLSVGNGYIRGYAAPKYDKATGSKNETGSTKPPVSNDAPNREVVWTGVVNTEELNVRTWAGTENGKIISYPTIRQETKVGVCDTIKDKDGDPWYFVKISGAKGDKYGFVSAAYITKQATSKPSSLKDDGKITKTVQFKGKVTASVLNVRTWAGTNNAKLKSVPTIKKGEVVEVCDVVNATDGSRWYYIRIDGKVYGFVHSAYIKEV